MQYSGSFIPQGMQQPPPGGAVSRPPLNRERAFYRVMHTSHGYNFARILFSIPYFRGTENTKIIEKVCWNNRTVGLV